MLVATFAMVMAGLLVFSAEHLEKERAPTEEMVVQIAGALTAELDAEPGAREALTRVLRRLNEQPTGSLRYRDPGTAVITPPAAIFEVPAWFGRLVGAETKPRTQALPGLSGELLLYPTDAADLYEKWVAFVITLAAPVLLGLLAFGISQLTVQATLRPLHELGAAIARLREGDYNRPVDCDGPPEIRRACEQINALSGVLTTLRNSNHAFMKRIVSAQDDERAEIGRDLHDEFSPLLFAARANARALQAKGGAAEVKAIATEISRIVESIQKTNSRLLARLRPLDLENLGLIRNITALIDSPAAKAGNLAADIKLDPALDQLDELSARTVYRFVQEAITNVLRHAKASQTGILATIQGSSVTAEVSDNGIGMAEDTLLGRGLLGMKERIDALGGTFLVASNPVGTVVRCTLPVS
jgi:two-component system sensor histidine kinase UhpB